LTLANGRTAARDIALQAETLDEAKATLEKRGRNAMTAACPLSDSVRGLKTSPAFARERQLSAEQGLGLDVIVSS
jgi:hypothetical protein